MLNRLSKGFLATISLGALLASSNFGFAASQTIKIAYEGALTGPVAFFGIPIGNGVQLAVAQNQEALAKLGIDLQYVPADDQVDAAQAPTVARKVIQDADIIGVVGPIFGSTTNAVGPLYTQASVPMLTMGTAAALATKGWTMFRVVPNDDLQAAAVADYMTKALKITKIGVIDDGTQYGHGLAAAVKAQVAKDGGSVVVEEAIDPNGDDFSSTVSKITASGAKGVFLGASVNTETVFNRQLVEGGYSGTFFAPDGTLSPDYVKLAGPSSEGTYFTSQAAPVADYGGPKDGPLATFFNDYKAKFSADAQAYSAEGFDATSMIVAAIKSGVRDRAGLVDYLRSKDYRGLTRTYKFQANGEPESDTSINIYQIKNGKIAWLGASSDLTK
ncbi:branched-chain amino acid ABC transporter substrate-binding protein [Lichenifustis flavocetrariae]|uniref:Branched-chain amino acid ABC transporter substrate-binding protein n=1 Tax=Lichenifustis flavocetrariae TaxID=2949735 RepID=A0AA42CQ87_9HYPH|nr:branched-chain amino acid ABC transporter substrate-binding protein [Lichenifustis flavocetrariae]MCW6511207.1 branched-chain amino acid ABC transporter substrate-binding protein [Lichenifustis flavocetrariae]